jgi:hypothetical protein
VAGNSLSIERPYLSPGAPNPFEWSPAITYAIPNAGVPTPVRLSIFDPAGRMVRALVESRQSAGVHTVSWNGRNERGEAVAAGVYLCRLHVGGEMLARRIVLIR